MKLIAHRGASLARPENSLDSLSYAASLGADAVECDVRRTKDGKYVIYHDADLKRLAGVDASIHERTLPEIRAALKVHGRGVLTFEELMDGYTARVPILLHMKQTVPEDTLLTLIKHAPADIICGVQTLSVLDAVRHIRPPERILAFMPEARMYPEFSRGGAGIIRLWQHWLPAVTPDIVREAHGGEVFVMMWRDGSMNGDAESLDYIHSLGTDGVLLNDIELALRWKAEMS